MDKNKLFELRKTAPEVYDKLCKINLNIKKINTLFKCLDNNLIEKGVFSDKDISNLFDIINSVLRETLDELDDFKD